MRLESEYYRIMLVEDDAKLASTIADALASDGFYVLIERRADIAVERITVANPDAVVLDISLSDLDGCTVCETVRASYHGIIILLMSGNGKAGEVVGLQAGADSCMVKPVRLGALSARLRTQLCRVTPGERHSGPLVVGSLMLDAARRRVEIAGAVVDLSTTEFDLLHLLAMNAGRTLSRKEISQRVRSTDHAEGNRSIDAQVARLRRRIGDDARKPLWVKSVRGIGYMLAREP